LQLFDELGGKFLGHGWALPRSTRLADTANIVRPA
jgi:hypothetical protein